MTNPAQPTGGYGELIRAQRLYMGLSQRELARTIPMDRRTYQRIEGGAEHCPAGFLDTMTNLVDTFDREVDETVEAANKMVGNKIIDQSFGERLARMVDPDAAPSPTSAVHFRVVADEDPAHIWTRAVIGRAAVESGLIMPTVDSDMEVKSA